MYATSRNHNNKQISATVELVSEISLRDYKNLIRTNASFRSTVLQNEEVQLAVISNSQLDNEQFLVTCVDNSFKPGELYINTFISNKVPKERYKVTFKLNKRYSLSAFKLLLNTKLVTKDDIKPFIDEAIYSSLLDTVEPKSQQDANLARICKVLRKTKLINLVLWNPEKFDKCAPLNYVDNTINFDDYIIFDLDEDGTPSVAVDDYLFVLIKLTDEEIVQVMSILADEEYPELLDLIVKHNSRRY